MPKPKESPRVHLSRDYFEKEFHGTKSKELPRGFACNTIDFFDVIEKRRSRRSFNVMSLHDISTLLWFSQRHIGNFENGDNRVTTPIPTPGGLASIRTIVIQPDDIAWLYEPRGHRSIELAVSSKTSKSIRCDAGKFFDITNGILLLYVASEKYISEYYDPPETLVLREAGVLLGMHALISEAFDFAFCPLGTTAETWLITLLGCSKEAIIPCGASVVGRR